MKKVLKRFVEIWKPDFIHNLTTSKKEKNLNTTIWFWVLNGFLGAFLLTGVFVVFGFIFKIGLPEMIRDFSREVGIVDEMGINFEDGVLSTQNINEPIFYEEEGFLFILDTKTSEYDDPSMLKDYDSGIILLKDKAYGKDDEDLGFGTAIYKDEEIPNFSMNFGELKEYINLYFPIFILAVAFVVFIVTFLILTVFRLITALWWALILFILSLIMKNEVSYGKAYESVLNLYFIPLLLEISLFFMGWSFKFSTLLIFLVLFLVNLFHIKNNKKEEIENVENKKSENINQS